MNINHITRNAVTMAKEHPETFAMLSQEAIKAVSAGDFVKVCFLSADGLGERIWIRVARVKGGKIIGHVDNKPVLDLPVSLGQQVTFDLNRIYQIMRA